MLAALRSRDFRLLWMSQSVSVIGDALVIVAIGLFVTRRTHSAGDVGLVLAGYSLPLVLFLLIGGVIADRLPRHRVMVGSDLVRAALHGTLAVLIATDAVRIWHMVVIGALYGTAEAFFRPAYTGLVPQTVPEADIQGAQALGGLSSELAELASPALATLLVLGAGGAVAFGIDAATFLVSAALLWRIRPRRRNLDTPTDRPAGDGSTGSRSVLAELTDGWGEVRSRPWVLGTIVAFSVLVFASLAPFYVLGAGVAGQEYGDEAVFGWANAAYGLGSVVGAAVASRWQPRHPIRTGLLACLPWSASVAIYASGVPVGFVYAALVIGGVGFAAFLIWWETALATRIPPQKLSRVSAWDWMGSLAFLPLGYVLSGPIAQVIGARTALVGGGLIGLAATAAALLPSSTRQLERLDNAPPVNPPVSVGLERGAVVPAASPAGLPSRM